MDLKLALCTQLVLQVPLPDHPIMVHTEASQVELGMVLSQEPSKGECSVFFSELEMVGARTKLLRY